MTETNLTFGFNETSELEMPSFPQLNINMTEGLTPQAKMELKLRHLQDEVEMLTKQVAELSKCLDICFMHSVPMY